MGIRSMVKRFANGAFLEYGPGSFDDWCVYLTSPTGECRPPLDTYYFQTIIDIAEKYELSVLIVFYVYLLV